MENTTDNFQALKEILENAHNPGQLDSHPWVESLIIQEASEQSPDLAQRGSGQQLVTSIAELFTEMMPSMPPKQGTRLDSQWGEFGMLAALYFAPLRYGTPPPPIMRDAWGRIDESILLFVREGLDDPLTDEQTASYQLVGEELEVGPASTMSDWNRRGTERLLEVVLARERFLETDLAKESPILYPPQEDGTKDDQSQPSLPSVLEKGEESKKEDLADRLIETPVKKWRSRWYLLIPVALIILVAMAWVGNKARRVYILGENIRQDVSQAKSLSRSPLSFDDIDRAVSLLETLGNDLNALDEEMGALWEVTNRLGWVPVYGGDLASAQTLLEVGQQLVEAADKAYQAAEATIQHLDQGGQLFPPSNITGLLVEGESQFLEAREKFDQAVVLRSSVDARRLSPKARNVVNEQLDPMMALMDDGLAVAISLPKLLGATSEGPKTYLLLAQNEDELRPTGGFITAVGNLVVQNGDILSLDFEDSGNVDAENTAYPMAPWQLREYMNSPILVLRDANWFTDYPTTAIWAEYLNAYTAAHSVDGVIAFDQQMLAMLLEGVGSLDVDGAPWPITSDNVIEYLRLAKIPYEEGGLRLPGEEKKESVNKITKAIFEHLLAGEGVEWEAFPEVLLRVLNERHLLLQFDDELISGVVSRHHWDGAVRPEEGDFLMVVDSNIGFNKVNTRIARNLSYDVDLTDLENMTSRLSVFHENQVTDEYPCIMGWSKFNLEQDYPINGCYWNYMRVYIHEEGNLADIIYPPVVPNARMVANRSMPEPRVDLLDEEIDSVKSFGTLMVVPTGEAIATSFEFALPDSVVFLDPNFDLVTYQLKIQKQPGTEADPVIVRLHIPEQAVVESVHPTAVVQKNNLVFDLELRTDIEIEVIFKMP